MVFQPDSVVIPARLRETPPGEAGEGAAWLAELPGQVAELAREWRLTLEPPFETDGCCAWVAPVRLEDGSDAVLKVSWPHSEARHEGDALRLYDGDGAPRLIRASEDGFSLLMERCLPGALLWSLPPEERDEVGARVLRRLWRHSAGEVPFDRLEEIAASWGNDARRSGEYEPVLLEEALSVGRELAASQPSCVLLHGDFHPGNVLAAEREPWMAIDCKPLVGEPAFDLAQWLGNCLDVEKDLGWKAPDPAAYIRFRLERMCGLLDLDRTRAAGWLFAKAVGWAFGSREALLFRDVMRYY